VPLADPGRYHCLRPVRAADRRGSRPRTSVQSSLKRCRPLSSGPIVDDELWRSRSGQGELRAYNGSGTNGFSRAWYDVAWNKGTDTWYGAAYYIPSKAAMPCWSMLARWDNYATYGGSGDTGGLEVD